MRGAGARRVFDPADPTFVADPYPTYAWLRDHDPVHRSPSGAFVITRHADVVAALGDSRLGNAPSRYAVVHERNRARYLVADVAANILPFLDPPRHTAMRKVVARAFFEHLRRRPVDVDRIAGRLLESCAGRDRIEVIGDFAQPLAAAVMAELFGLSPADAAGLDGCAESFFFLFAPMPSEAVRERADAGLTEFRGRFAEVVERRRREPGADLVSAMIAAGQLGDAELVDTCMLLYADGIENVDRGIGNAVFTLLRHPDAWALLRERPDLVPSAVQECLRFESAAQSVPRIARENLELHGVAIPRDAAVLLVLGAANRDPRVFAQPDRFDVTRQPNPHLAFGQGRHACLGGPLVEAELAAAIRALLERWPRLELASTSSTWIPRTGHRWIAAVPVRCRR